MNILSPSILAADCARLGEQINQVKAGGAQYLHIDVMDGMFVPSISFGMCVVASLREATDLVFDVHLMVENPIRYIEEFARDGADIITVHLEACPDVQAVIDKIHSLGKKAGISVKPGTPVEEVGKYLDKIDLFLLMTVEPGFGGQKYIEASTARIRQIRQMIEEGGHQTDVEVDGGITADNAELVMEAGANVIVAGSAVFGGDILQNTKDFMALLNR